MHKDYRRLVLALGWCAAFEFVAGAAPLPGTELLTTPGDLSERISPLDHIRAARRRGVPGIRNVSRWDIEHLSRVHPPAHTGIRGPDGMDSGTALLRDAA